MPQHDFAEPLRRLCEQAGAAIVEHYLADSAGEHTAKDDDSPLTAADLASHRILLQGLEPLGLPVLSEESDPTVVQQRRQWRRYWLVDPLDGTREFLERTGEYTINIALIEGHRPVLGVVSVPLQETVYLGIRGQGAWRFQDGRWQSIRCRNLEGRDTAVVLTSRRHRGERLDACLGAVEANELAVQREYVGSALKFCQLAEGAADFYPRFSPCSEWDTGAGQALLEAAGGGVYDLGGTPLRYNQRDTLLNPYFYAVGDPGSALWREIFAE